MRVLLPLLLIILIITPVAVFAFHEAGHTSIVPECTGGKCTFQDLKNLVQSLLNFLIFYLAVPLSAVAIMIGGAYFIFGATSESKRETAKKIFWTAVWGLVIVLAAWLIVTTILRELGYPYEHPPAPSGG